MTKIENEYLKCEYRNSNITNINSDFLYKQINFIENIEENIKHNYAIDNIWIYIFNIDIVNTYTITSSKVTLFEYIIEGIFITNSVLEISCNILYKYANYNDVGLLRHIYSLFLIQQPYFCLHLLYQVVI